MRMASTSPGTDVIPEIEESTRTRQVPPYHVILLNDDHHSMPFVVEVLIKALGCTKERAFEFMLEAHTSGRAVVWTAPEGSRRAEGRADVDLHRDPRSTTTPNWGPLGVEALLLGGRVDAGAAGSSKQRARGVTLLTLSPRARWAILPLA